MFERIEGVEKPQFFNVLLIDTEKDAPQIIKTPGGLDEWHKLIGCNMIDIQERYIDGHAYDFITDDEALYRGRKCPGLIRTGSRILSVTWLFVGATKKGTKQD